MKRLIFLVLCLILCVFLFAACTQHNSETVSEETEPTVFVLPTDYTFPVSTTLAGTDVSAMTVSDAYNAICNKTAYYTLTISVNGKNVFLSGNDLDLSCDQDALTAYATALATGESPDGIRLITYDEEVLKSRIFNAANTPAKNASIVFNAETGLYELAAGSTGKTIEIDPVMETVDASICQLQHRVLVQAPLLDTLPQISEASTAARAALSTANDYLSTQIAYNFIVDDEIISATLTGGKIAALLGFDSELNPYIKRDALRAYVNDLNKQYGMTGIDGTFKTSRGANTDMTVTYYAQSLDVNALYDDILYYLDNNLSVAKFAPTLDVLVPQETPYRGSYIEVDLTSQRLWLYKENELVLETPIVTGCVSRYMNTPTGVYKILVRRMHVILTGEDYETYVKYWMQFRGGYGLHDAYWRSNFGSNEYLYNGSHGCVNIPPDNAAIIYENVYSGYPVIVHGGATNKGRLQQTITGTETYNTSIYTKPFQLDATLAIGNGKMIYNSTDPSVASVTDDGTVTVHKSGRAFINVIYEETRYYTAASMRVIVNVADPCEGDHSFDEWVTTTEPTCAKGIQTRICKFCNMEQYQYIPAVDHHCYGEWKTTAKPGCKNGEEQKTCEVCSHSLHRSIPAEHTMGYWRTATKPTCVEPGEEYRSCRYCDYEERQAIEPTGHDFIEGRTLCQNGTCKEVNPAYPPPTEPEEDE